MHQPLDFPYYFELQKRLEELFLFVACNEKNFNTHSIKIENLFVDTCAFFESLCQSFILDKKEKGEVFKFENEVQDIKRKLAGDKFFGILDFRMLLENEFALSEKELNLNLYEEHYFGNPQEVDLPAQINGYKIKPLESWKEDKTPAWWSAFTQLKHNRLSNIKKGNLKHLINAFGATYILLSVKNEDKFKKGKVPAEIYNVFYPKYWSYKGRVARGIVKWH